MEFDEEELVAQKCDLCVDRLDRGLEPACVAVCPSHCIHHGDAADVAQVLRENRLLAWYKAGAD
jgi:Fe-S-cluster-containing dehydrogenase component